MPTNPNWTSPIWRPYTQMETAPTPLLVDWAKEAVLHLVSGENIIDAISSWWVITHGHCHPKIMEAIRKQTETLDQVIFAGFSHQKAEQLADLLLRLMPKPLEHVFYSDNGSTAVEVALKMALQACHQRGRPTKTKFITLEHAYHGDTVGAMSVGANSSMTAPYKSMFFPVIHLSHGRHSNDSISTFTRDAIDKIEQHKNEVAGIIIEPLVQGAGGMIVWPREAVEIIVRTAKEHDIYVIFDEVMTGFGRTGSLFAFDQLEVKPDILCLSKGITGGALPLAATVTTTEVFASFLSKRRDRMFFHGHSFTGNPISCAAAVANLELIGSTNLPAKWQMIEKIHRRRISRVATLDRVVDTRVCGTIAAIELQGDSGYLADVGQRIYRYAIDHDVLLRPLGNVIYILPPYCITELQLAQTWDVLANAILSMDQV